MSERKPARDKLRAHVDARLRRGMPLPSVLLDLIRQLESGASETWIVGGAVRDWLLGRDIQDIDLATAACPGEAASLVRAQDWAVLPTGLPHGTQTFLHRETNKRYEVSSFRGESGYRDRRHPDRVRFGLSFSEDLRRRDFTMNAMAWSPSRGFRDDCGGLDDLCQRRIRCVGSARERFAEDALRIFRALRFAVELDFSWDPDTETAMLDGRGGLAQISGERLREECRRMLAVRHLPLARPLRVQAILSRVLPALDDAEAAELPNLEARLRWAASLAPDPVLRAAALCIREESDLQNGTENAPAVRRARALSRNLRLSGRARERILQLLRIAAQDFPADNYHLRRQRLEADDNLLQSAWQIRLAVLGAKRRTAFAAWEAASGQLARLAESEAPLTLNALEIGGEVLGALGYRGREIGRELRALQDRVLRDRLPNARTELLDAAKKDRPTTSEEAGGRLSDREGL